MTVQTLPHGSAKIPSTKPAVSVIIPVYNSFLYIESAVRSMMAQTLQDIEIIIVDDGSNDGTSDVLHRLALEDRRLRVEKLERNLGIVGASNHGLGIVRSNYVARMDSDDVAHPERLAIQKRYMDLHPSVVALGTSLRRVRADGTPFQISVRPRDAFMCRWIMRFRLSVVHPTVMFRYPMPDGSQPLYDPRYPVTEDHDFFVRMLSQGKIVCLPDVLLDYRHHDNNVTKTHSKQLNANAEIICRQFMTEELPAEVVVALEPAILAYFRFSSEPASDVIAGFRHMLRHDIQVHPSYRTWLKRQTAQLAFDTLVRSGRSRREVGLAFLKAGRDLLPFLALRFAETSRVLPQAMTSYVDVWASPGGGSL